MSKKRLIEGDVFSAMTSATVLPATPQPIPTGVQQPFVAQVRMSEPVLPKRSTEVGLPDGMIRATIIAPKNLIEKCRDIAYWERLRDQDVYGEALLSYIEKYEKKMGKAVEPRPESARRSK